MTKAIIVKRFNASAGWREIAGKRMYFRSKWEANYARFLEFLECCSSIAKWEHEPYTFWFEGIKRGVVSYLPDFKVTRVDGTHYWVEVKGHFDARSVTKLKRMAKYHPKEQVMVVDKSWFQANTRRLRGWIKEWE